MTPEEIDAALNPPVHPRTYAGPRTTDIMAQNRPYAIRLPALRLPPRDELPAPHALQRR
jgi:hypothetical protein